MAQEQSPAFQFYVKEWRSSRSIMRMTFAQRGMYLEMLLEQWESLTLPDDPAAVAEIIGGTASEWARAWPVLRRRFLAESGGRIYNLRLEKERAKQRSGHKRASDKGKAGAAARWQKSSTGIVQPSSSDARAVPVDSIPIAIPIAIPTADKSAPAKQRPIFSGQRLTVFPWMVDDLFKALGSHAEAFDLSAWFWKLDEQATHNGLVIPDRDNGAWLKAQTLAEARRRGLPFASAGKPVQAFEREECLHEPRCASPWAHGQLQAAEQSGDAELVAGVRRLHGKRATA